MGVEKALGITKEDIGKKITIEPLQRQRLNHKTAREVRNLATTMGDRALGDSSSRGCAAGASNIATMAA